MDVLLLMTVTLAGGISLGWSAARPSAHIWQVLLAWPAIAWLAVYFIKLTWGMGATDLLEWRGTVEMGPITLVLIVVGVSWLWMGASENASE